MALNTRVSNATRIAVEAAANVLADTVGTMLNSGYMEIYSGPIPERCGDTLPGNKALVKMVLSAKAYKAAIKGTILANEVVSGVAVADGKPTHFCVFTKDGVAVYDGTVGISKSNLVLPIENIQKGMTVGISRLIFNTGF